MTSTSWVKFPFFKMSIDGPRIVFFGKIDDQFSGTSGIGWSARNNTPAPTDNRFGMGMDDVVAGYTSGY